MKVLSFMKNQKCLQLRNKTIHLEVKSAIHRVRVAAKRDSMISKYLCELNVNSLKSQRDEDRESIFSTSGSKR